MSSTVMMALGAFRFGLSTAAYQDFERNNEYRWASIDRVGTRPAKQWIGEGDQTINLRGVIYPGFIAQRNGLGQLPAMREQAGLGLPLLLVSGSGRVFGEHVITSIREGQRTFFSDGTPRSIEFDISMVAYGG